MKQMNVLLTLFLIASVSGFAQPKTKEILIEGEGVPIVMLNGGTADMSVFEPHSKQLSTAYKVIRMQQFNVQYANEGSTLPRNYSVQMESEGVKATLDSLNVKEPIILVGHSYGGLIAFDFALNHPGYIHSLVLIEPPVFAIAEEKNGSVEGMKQMQELLKKLTPQANITEELIQAFRCALMDCDSVDIRRHTMWKTWVKQKNRLRGLSVICQYRLDYEKLHEFQKPVLILTGTQSVLFHKKIDELLTAEFSLAKAANISGGHTAVNTGYAEFIKHLVDFLDARK
jgi:pimeloyl-ACP methyl ester carboxylesterase